MLKALIAAAGLIWAAIGWAAPSCEKLIASGNPEYPPYLWRNPADPRHLIGANADLLQELGQALGIKIEVIYSGSWARAQNDAYNGRIDLLAGAFLTMERLAKVDYVHPRFFTVPNEVWVAAGHEFAYQGLSDLQGRTGATVVDTSFGQDFDQYAKQNLTLKQLPSLTQAFQMLLLGRVDYVLYERFPGEHLARQLGMSEQLKTLPAPVSSEGLYLALSHNSACNEAQLRGQLAQKMTELTASGRPQVLLQDNIERWLLQNPALPQQLLKAPQAPE